MLPATYALKLLARQGLWTLTEAVVHPATLQFTCSRHDIDHLEERYPNLHYICTGILRMYGTVFHFPTTIRLGAIAKQLRLKIEDIQSALTYLTNMQLLQFTQAKEGPQLYFHHYRVDSRHLILDTASIAKLKQQKQKRIDALWQFVTEETACRERMILHYFGEESTTDCGHCDNCQKRLRPYVLDEDKIKAEIAQHLKNYPVGTIQDIVHLFEERHQTKVIYLIRELAEKEILAIDLNNQYQCKKT
jgi:ATP-dependent DNA helicase RecQ